MSKFFFSEIKFSDRSEIFQFLFFLSQIAKFSLDFFYIFAAKFRSFKIKLPFIFNENNVSYSFFFKPIFFVKKKNEMLFTLFKYLLKKNFSLENLVDETDDFKYI